MRGAGAPSGSKQVLEGAARALPGCFEVEVAHTLTEEAARTSHHLTVSLFRAVFVDLLPAPSYAVTLKE